MSNVHRIPRHSVKVSGHRTSVCLEPEFWIEIRRIAQRDGMTINALISQIGKTKIQHGNLSSACRIEVLKDLLSEISSLTAKAA